MPFDEPLDLELAQPRREQPVGDARDGRAVLREAAGAAHPGEQDRGGPLATGELDRGLEAAARGLVDVPEVVQAFAVHGRGRRPGERAVH